MRTVDKVLRIAACSLALLGSATMRVFADSPLSPTGSLSAEPDPDQPADLIGQGFFHLAIARGKQSSVRLVVKNNNTEPMTIRAYPVDGQQTTGGGIGFNTFDKPTVSAGTWLTLDPPSAEFAPGETRRLTATISVAADATPGDHVAGIAVEDAHATQSGTGTQVLINVYYRRVIAVVVAVPGVRTAALEVDSVALSRDVRGSQAIVQVRNTGNTLYKPKGTFEFTDQAGGRPQVFSVDTLIPGAATSFAIPMPNVTLAPGTYKVRVAAQTADGQGLADWQGRAGFLIPAQAEATAVPAADVSLVPTDAPSAAAVAAISDQDAAAISRRAAETNSVGYWLMGILGVVLLRVVIVRRRRLAFRLA